MAGTGDSKKKLVWINANIDADINVKRRLISTALENGFTDFVVHKNDAKELEKVGKINTIFMEGGKIIIGGSAKGQLFILRNKEDEENIKKYIGKIEYAVVSAVDWKVIPVENLIAVFHKSDTKLLLIAATADEAKLFLETLEVGADGVFLNTLDAKEIAAVEAYIGTRSVKAVPLSMAKVVRIKHLGLGDRVCVDTCSLLEVGEGILVGSQSSGMFLVHSETLSTEYVNPRPFRVNAGAVHAYTLQPTGETKYLSELRAGDEVFAIDSKGNGRALVVGRAKIERRPLLLIEAEAGGTTYNTVVQNAETTRLVTKDGAKSVADLKVGDEVLMRIEAGGRHFGVAVKEHIKEL